MQFLFHFKMKSYILLVSVFGLLPNVVHSQAYVNLTRTFWGMCHFEDHYAEPVGDMQTVVFIIHGWMASTSQPWFLNMSAILQEQYYYTIFLEWSTIASNPNYLLVDTYFVGSCLANYISRHPKLKRVELVGHSLGAHVAGFAGRRLRDRGRTVQKIVGLDVAGPSYDFPFRGLTRNDAKNVVVLHTNAGFLGSIIPRGTCDFYPNGGVLQPPCKCDEDCLTLFKCMLSPRCILEMKHQNIEVSSCSHVEANLIFNEALANSTKFMGQACTGTSDVIMDPNDVKYFNIDVTGRCRSLYCFK